MGYENCFVCVVSHGAYGSGPPRPRYRLRHPVEADGAEADAVNGVDDRRPQGLAGRPVSRDPAVRQDDDAIGEPSGEPEVVQAIVSSA